MERKTVFNLLLYIYITILCDLNIGIYIAVGVIRQLVSLNVDLSYLPNYTEFFIILENKNLFQI